VFGSVSGRSSPESVSEDLQEPSSFHDKYSSNLGGTSVSIFNYIRTIVYYVEKQPDIHL